LSTEFADKLKHYKSYQNRKLDSIMDDLEEMEGEIPILEIDESLKGLQKSEYSLSIQNLEMSSRSKQQHQKRKLDSIMDDLEEMEGEIPILEIDETLKGLQKSERWYYDKFQLGQLGQLGLGPERFAEKRKMVL